MSDLPEPVKVSPLIKFLRYSFLIAGIVYGASKLKTFQIIEEGRKEEKERKKLERETRIAQEKKAASERDIAQIVAIFTGKPEADTGVTGQSYLPKQSKLEADEVKHTLEKEKTCSDDLSTCTVEEVKQMVQEDKTGPSPTINTEYGSIDGNERSVPSLEETSESKNGDIFSDVFNLAPSKEKRSHISTIRIKSNVTSESNGSEKDVIDKSEDKPSKQDGYYVESFTDRLPYAEPETCKEDFFGKDEK